MAEVEVGGEDEVGEVVEVTSGDLERQQHQHTKPVEHVMDNCPRKTAFKLLSVGNLLVRLKT